MREVAILGIGQVKVEERWDDSLRVLAGEAALAALHDAGLEKADAVYIGNMMSGSANHQQHLGPYITDWIGSRFADSMKLEAACSSGAAAFRAGVMAVASGSIETALIVGVEKMTDSPGDEVTAALATAADADWEVDQGLSFIALNALIMRRYMHQYGWQKNDFAGFSINAHANAVHNPFARFRSPITQASYEKAAMICDPINLMDASPIGDGAAAAVLVPLERLKVVNGSSRIKVSASSAATDSIAAHDRQQPTWLTAAEMSVQQAYQQADILPADIDFFELHDAFSIMSALSLEACGFAEPGKGVRLALDGDITSTGRIPISTLGGLKARGHPVGATGMYQITEAVHQLRGTAGEAQIPDATIGMTQNIGGSGSNIITHILQKM